MEIDQCIGDVNPVCGALSIDENLNVQYPALDNFIIPNKSVILATSGRMGNQFFQYAAAYSLAKQTEARLYVVEQNCAACRLSSDPSQDTTYYLTQFNLSQDVVAIPATEQNIPLIQQYYTNYPDIRPSFTKHLPAAESNAAYIFSSSDFYKELKLKSNKTKVIANYLEEPKLFDNFYDQIIEQFVIPNFDTSNIDSILAEIQQDNSICMNVRRKEYVTTPWHIPIDYQIAAMEFIESNNLVESPKYFVISDDIPLVKQSLEHILILNILKIRHR